MAEEFEKLTIAKSRLFSNVRLCNLASQTQPTASLVRPCETFAEGF
jgi:hypothetical protein